MTVRPRRFFRTGSRPPSVLEDADAHQKTALAVAHSALQVIEAGLMAGRIPDLKLVRSTRKFLTHALHGTSPLPDLDEGLLTLAKRIASEVQSEVNAAAKKVAEDEREGESDEGLGKHKGS